MTTLRERISRAPLPYWTNVHEREPEPSKYTLYNPDVSLSFIANRILRTYFGAQR